MTAEQKRRTDDLVTENTPLVKSIVRHFMGRGVDFDDLFQIGAIGLIKAAEGYDESYGTKFSTYAVPKIMGEIKRFLRDDGAVKVSRSIKERSYAVSRARDRLAASLGREPKISEIAEEAGLDAEDAAICMEASRPVCSLDAPITEEGGSLLDITADTYAEDRLIERVSLYDAMEKLEENERKVLALRFFRDMTQQKTADILGFSQVKVSRTERKAIAKLRKLLE